MKRLLLGAVVALALGGAALAQTPAIPSYSATAPYTGNKATVHEPCVWRLPSGGDYDQLADADVVSGAARACFRGVVDLQTLVPVSLAENLTLAASACSTPVANIPGGSYLAAIQATFGGSTIQLQTLGPNKTTYMATALASWTAESTTGVVLGANATVRVCNTGGASVSGLYVALS